MAVARWETSQTLLSAAGNWNVPPTAAPRRALSTDGSANGSSSSPNPPIFSIQSSADIRARTEREREREGEILFVKVSSFIQSIERNVFLSKVATFLITCRPIGSPRLDWTAHLVHSYLEFAPDVFAITAMSRALGACFRRCPGSLTRLGVLLLQLISTATFITLVANPNAVSYQLNALFHLSKCP